MTTTELLGQAAWVMIFGMAIVFIFLTILIWAINLSSKVIKLDFFNIICYNVTRNGALS